MAAGGIVGRERELAGVDEAVARSAAAGATLLLVGEPGLGKSRLAGMVADRAREEGRRVLVGRTSPLDLGHTLGVVQDALRAAAREGVAVPGGGDALARRFPSLLLPELGGGPDGAAADRAVLFEACARHLRALAGDRGVVLVLEDLHWADATSHALLHSLARALRDDPVLLLGTLRQEEAPPSLRVLMRELTRERLADVVLLDPLDQVAVGRLVEDLLGVPPSPAALDQLARRSGGNPFVVEEMVREAAACGCVDTRTGGWDDRERLPLPRTVQDLVLARVERLGEPERRLLEAAAVVGERFDLALAAEAAGLPPADAVAAAERLRDAALVREPDADTLAFRHAITREAVLAGLLSPQLRLLHAAVLDAARRQGAPADLLAVHAIAAGDRAAALAASRDAATRSLLIGGASEAVGHLDRALGLWRPDDGPAARAELLVDLGRAHVALGELAEAMSAFAEARGILTASGDQVGAALALVHLGEARGDAGEREAALADMGRAVGELDGAPEGARLRALARLARALMMAGRIPDARAAGEAGLALVGEAPAPADRRERMHLLTTLGTCALEWDDLPRCRAALEEGLALAEAAGDAMGTVRAIQNLASIALDRPPAELLALVARGIALARRRGMRTHEIWLHNLNAGLMMGAGDLDGAERELDESEVLRGSATRADYAYEGIDLLIGQAILAEARGDAERAAELARAAVPLAERVGDLQLAWPARAALGQALLALRDVAGARAALTPALDAALYGPGPMGVLPWVVMPALALAAVAPGGMDPDRVEALVDIELRCDRPSARPAARALADLALGRPAAPGALAETARTLAEGDGWRLDALHVAAWGAWALAEREDGAAEAAELARITAGLAADMGAPGWERRAAAVLRGLGRPAPALRSGPGAGGLTGRETEVLRLVADGLTNKEIAARLVISEATAARHVANCFTKLGVHNRAEATRLAVERGLLAAASR